MREIFVTGNTLPSAYHNALMKLNIFGEESDCSDWNCKQLELSMTIHVTEPLREPMISKCFIGGARELEQYRMEMLDGILDFEVERGKWTYTYHQRMGEQIQFVIDELRRNPSSRRAVMCIRTPEDMGSDDPACFCAGTRVFTPRGYMNIESISDGDEVYVYDFAQDKYIKSIVSDVFETKSNCLKISTFFGDIEVSNDQLLYTKDGWKKACELSSNDQVLYSDIRYVDTYSLWNLIGCIIGDGWISTPVKNKKNAKRKDVCMSTNYKSIDINIEKMLKSFTDNKVSLKEYAVDSELVSGGHITKKYEISDYSLHDALMNYIPCGKKTTGDMLFGVNDLSRKQAVEFLTGVFSSEGCVTYRRNVNGDRIPHIEIVMVWKECINVISDMLNMLDIQHKMYHLNECYKIRISGIEPLMKFIHSGIDFRFDSRKQIKFLNLKYVCHKTQEAGEKHCGKTKWQYVNLDMMNNALFVNIDKITDIGKKTVYDFTVNDQNHNIIANNFIAHNCLQHLQYFIRDGKLDCVVLFRSNDACKATFMNAFALIMLQKRIAFELGVPVGTYTHRANSFHCYQKDYDMLNAYVQRISISSEKDLTYRYVGDWHELMEDERDDILAMVEELKSHE